MPRQRSLALTVLLLTLGLFTLLIFRDARAGGKKAEAPAPNLIDAPRPLVTPKNVDFPEVTPPPVPGMSSLPSVPPSLIPQPIPLAPPIKSSIWTFTFEIKEGRMHLTARAKGQEFKVACDNLEMQAPRGQVTAQGKVAIGGANLEAAGEKLTIQFGEDTLLLEGKARVKCRSIGVQEVDLAGERFTLRLNDLRPADKDFKDKTE